MKKLTGRCLCGEIAYEITGELGPIVNCHCNMCRRWHGSAYRTRCTVKSKDFKWLKGEELLSTYESSKNRLKTFCKNCGSNLISLYQDDPEHIGLPIGALEQDPGEDHRPVMHILVKYKSPWHEITDDLPQCQEFPEDDFEW